jgi:hypothetical protein
VSNDIDIGGALKIGGSNVLSLSTSNVVFSSAGGMFTWQNQSATNMMQLDNNGKLTVIADLNAYGSITSASDIRLKSDIVAIEGALDKVAALRGVNFTMHEKRQTGLIAQEVHQVAPEAVSEMADGHLSVAYGNLVGLLVEAIKELKAQVAALRK